jgi:hypothetical protein
LERWKKGALFSIQIEGGKRNGSGLQIDITGISGDLRILNANLFGNPDDNISEGTTGDVGALATLPIPRQYQLLPPTTLDVSVQDLCECICRPRKGSSDRRANCA